MLGEPPAELPNVEAIKCWRAAKSKPSRNEGQPRFT